MFGVLADLQSKIGSTSSYIDCYKSSCPKDWARVPSILVAESRFELPASLPTAFTGSEHPQCLQFMPMLPVFNFHQDRVKELTEASSGARKVSTIHQYGGLILGVAALYGVFLDSNTM